MKVGISQISLEQGKPKENYKKVEKIVKKVMQQKVKPEVIVLPELWTTGCDFEKERFKKLISPNGKKSEEFLGKLAKKYNIWFAGGSVACSTAEGLKCRAQVINSQGKLVTHYDKIHLFSKLPFDENETFIPGKELPEIFNLHNIPSACVICYDIRFCELIRKLALQGAKLLFVSSAWPLIRLDHWRYLLIARAIENQMYIVASNLTGKTSNNIYSGHSMAIDPWGRIIDEFDEATEGIIVIDVDINKVEEARKNIPIFADRRPNIYQL